MAITWTTKYANWSSPVGRIGTLNVHYSGPDGYDVSALGVRLKDKIADLDAAKAAAVRLASKLLADATASLTAD